jgi:hypothetical protein
MGVLPNRYYDIGGFSDAAPFPADGAGDLAAVVKPVGAHKAENPQQIADDLAVRILILHGD